MNMTFDWQLDIGKVKVVKAVHASALLLQNVSPTTDSISGLDGGTKHTARVQYSVRRNLRVSIVQMTKRHVSRLLIW